MKHGTVVFFSVVVFGVYWLSTLGGASVEAQLKSIFFLTPMYFCLVFGLNWNRSKQLEERLKKLESAVAERENERNPASAAKE